MENIENFFKDLTTNFNKLIGFKEGIRPLRKKYRHHKNPQYLDEKLKQQVSKAKDSARQAGYSAKQANHFKKYTKDSAKKADDFEEDANNSAKQANRFKNKANFFKRDAKDSADKAENYLKQTQKSIAAANALPNANYNAENGDALSSSNGFRNIENFNNYEGFVEGNIGAGAVPGLQFDNEERRKEELKAQEILSDPDKFRKFKNFVTSQIYAKSENAKADRILQASELLTQKDTIASNIIMDYLYKNEKGTNVHKIYDRIDQLNDDKVRKIEINTYYNKAYKEYINILKVIILVCIIIVPIIIANKNNMIPNSVTMFLVVAIIFLTVIFIIYKFSDIYMRDNKNFDKLRIPYDREAALLEKQGAITKKKNPLTSLTLTCIGQDCCDGSMVYDFAKNKCILSENFGNYFESMNNFNNGKTSYVEGLDGTINESFANCSVKQNLVANSLNCSEKEKFYSNDCLNKIEFNF